MLKSLVSILFAGVFFVSLAQADDKIDTTLAQTFQISEEAAKSLKQEIYARGVKHAAEAHKAEIPGMVISISQTYTTPNGIVHAIVSFDSQTESEYSLDIRIDLETRYSEETNSNHVQIVQSKKLEESPR